MQTRCAALWSTCHEAGATAVCSKGQGQGVFCAAHSCAGAGLQARVGRATQRCVVNARRISSCLGDCCRGAQLRPVCTCCGLLPFSTYLNVFVLVALPGPSLPSSPPSPGTPAGPNLTYFKGGPGVVLTAAEATLNQNAVAFIKQAPPPPTPWAVEAGRVGESQLPESEACLTACSCRILS